MRYLRTYEDRMSDDKYIRKELYKYVENVLIPNLIDKLGYDMKLVNYNEHYEYHINLDLPEEIIQKLKKDITEKYIIFNDIRKNSLFEVDNFFINKNNPRFNYEYDYVIKANINLYDNNTQWYIFENIPYLIPILDRNEILNYSLIEDDEVKELLDNEELGLL